MQEELRGAGRGGSENRRHVRVRNILVGSEFAVALLLLTGAGLMIRTMYALESINPGFNPNHVLTCGGFGGRLATGRAGTTRGILSEVLQRVNALAGH